MKILVGLFSHNVGPNFMFNACRHKSKTASSRTLPRAGPWAIRSRPPPSFCMQLAADTVPRASRTKQAVQAGVPSTRGCRSAVLLVVLASGIVLMT